MGDPGSREASDLTGLSLHRGSEADGGFRAGSAPQVGTRCGSHGPLLPLNLGGQGLLSLAGTWWGPSPSPLLTSNLGVQDPGPFHPPKAWCPSGQPLPRLGPGSLGPQPLSPPRTQGSRFSASPPPDSGVQIPSSLCPPDPGIQVPSSFLSLGPNVPAPQLPPHLGSGSLGPQLLVPQTRNLDPRSLLPQDMGIQLPTPSLLLPTDHHVQLHGWWPLLRLGGDHPPGGGHGDRPLDAVPAVGGLRPPGPVAILPGQQVLPADGEHR